MALTCGNRYVPTVVPGGGVAARPAADGTPPRCLSVRAHNLVTWGV